MIALDAEEVPGRGVVVRVASAVLPEWIFDLHPDLVDMTDELVWNTQSEQVDRVSRISSGSGRHRGRAKARRRRPPKRRSVLRKAVRARGRNAS